MGDQALPGVLAVGVVAAEHAHALGFEGDLHILVRDHHGVFRKGVGAEELRVDLDHLRLLAEILVDQLTDPLGVLRALGEPAEHRDGLATELRTAEVDSLKGADVHRGQVGGHGIVGFKHTSGVVALAVLLHQGAVGDGGDVPVGGDGYAEHRLFVRRIVAGEPAGGAIGLACHQGSAVGFLPANLAPLGAQRARVAAVLDGQVKGLILGNLVCESDR